MEIFDYGHTADGTFYYVMEYLPGMSIAELVERHGPLPPERVVYLLQQTCDALGEAHSPWLDPSRHQARKSVCGAGAADTTTWPSCSTSAWRSEIWATSESIELDR